MLGIHRPYPTQGLEVSINFIDESLIARFVYFPSTGMLQAFPCAYNFHLQWVQVVGRVKQNLVPKAVRKGFIE